MRTRMSMDNAHGWLSLMLVIMLVPSIDMMDDDWISIHGGAGQITTP